MAASISFSSPTPLVVDLGHEKAKAMIDLLKITPLPSSPSIPTAKPWVLGIDLEFLKNAKKIFTENWSLDELQRKVNQFPNYLVKYTYGGVDAQLHYVHVRCQKGSGIPLILLHGWPGSFHDFHKVIGSLANPPDGKLGFDVVVPSLPGYFLSTLPPVPGWDNKKVAEVLNGLMTQVLGYSVYVGQGGDWGSLVLRFLGYQFSDSVKLLHFNMNIFIPRGPDPDLEGASEKEKATVARRKAFLVNEPGYFSIQSTKPFTIGLAIASSPQAMLTWIGEKFYGWSDPSCLDVRDLIDTVALYYLSDSFPTSVMMYNQSSHYFEEAPAKDSVKILGKVGYSLFPFELGGATRKEFEAVSDLVFYKEHDKGGHFAALDVPEAYIADIREFVGNNW